MKVSNLCWLAAGPVSVGLARSVDASPYFFSYLAQDFSAEQVTAPTVASLVVVPPQPSSGSLSGNFSLPDGEQSNTFTATPMSATGGSSDASYSSFSGYQSTYDAQSPGTLTVTQGGQTSDYSFQANLGGIDGSTLPAVQITSPGATSILATDQPKFTWTDTGTFSTIEVSVYNDVSYTTYSQSLVPGQTNWTVPTPLSAGSWTFTIELSTAQQTVPLTTTLLDGPALDLPTTAAFSDEALGSVTFAVPEPACVGLLALPCLWWGRGRRRRSGE